MAYGNGGVMGSSPSTVAAAARPIGAVTEQMNVLDSRTADIHQLITELEVRLSSILEPVPPSDLKNAAVQPPAPLQLGASLNQMNERLIIACNRVRGLIDRVEL